MKTALPSKTPLWAGFIAVFLLLGVVYSCRDGAIKAINDASQWTNAYGDPLDVANDYMVCPDCGGWLKRIADYDYRCQKCGARMQVRWNSGDGKHEWHR